MPPPKEMPAIVEPEVINEIRTEEEKRLPVSTQHGRTGSFMSICSRKASFTVRKSI